MQTETNKKINILVTGVGGPAGINASRLFQKEDAVYVIGCDIDEQSTGRLFVDEFYTCPRVDEPEAYESWIREAVKKFDIDILLPTVHDELPLLRTFSNSLSCEVVISEAEVIAIGDDKKVAYEWATKNLPDNFIPWTLLADWTPDWSESAEQFIKPRQGRGARGCKKVAKEELAWLKDQPDTDKMIVMECMPGTEWTVDAYVSKAGEVVYTCVRERLGLTGGISIKGKTVKNQAVIDVTKKMLATLSCRGPVCIQWKADSQGIPRFIEINPRLSGGLMISRAAGVNPISNILREHTGETLSPQDWEEVTVLGYLDYKTI